MTTSKKYYFALAVAGLLGLAAASCSSSSNMSGSAHSAEAKKAAPKKDPPDPPDNPVAAPEATPQAEDAVAFDNAQSELLASCTATVGAIKYIGDKAKLTVVTTEHPTSVQINGHDTPVDANGNATVDVTATAAAQPFTVVYKGKTICVANVPAAIPAPVTVKYWYGGKTVDLAHWNQPGCGDGDAPVQTFQGTDLTGYDTITVVSGAGGITCATAQYCNAYCNQFGRIAFKDASGNYITQLGLPNAGGSIKIPVGAASAFIGYEDHCGWWHDNYGSCEGQITASKGAP